MISRDLQPLLLQMAATFPAVTLTGPRQSGKSTLVRSLFPRLPMVNLEELDLRQFAIEDPRAFLAQFPEGAILDEFQRVPGLASYLQGEIDRHPGPGRWILTGSQNLALMETVGQSLAGRTGVLHLLPLAHGEVRRFANAPKTLEATLFSGGYPRVYDQAIPPASWYSSYVATYVERDVRNVLKIGDLAAFQRFLALCAGRTSQLLNLSALASDAGVSQPTAKAWMSVLEASFLVFRLPAYHSNLGKRLVKMSKLHFYDTGLACWLLGIREAEQLRNHPLRGALFESWAVSEIVKQRTQAGESQGVYYFRDQHGLEADLVVESPNRIRVLEMKSGSTPASDMLGTASKVAGIMAKAFPASNLETIAIYGGKARQQRVHGLILPWSAICEYPFQQ